MANELIFDGTTDFLGGQDASKNPHKVPKNAYYAGVNVTTQNGVLGPRWGFSQIDPIFPEGGFIQPNLYVNPYKNLFRSGRFQAIIPHRVGRTNYLIIVISGTIFLFNQDTSDMSVLDLPDGDRISNSHYRVNWTNAGDYLVLFDYPAYPVIIEGIDIRRADPDKNEVPVSSLGAFNQSRLFIANAGNEFTASDAAGNLATPNAPITFDEIFTIGGEFFGQVFQLSTSNDPVTAMAFLQTVDTSTGIGTLLVGTKNSIYSYATQNPRSAWQAGQFGSLFTFNAGIAGARSFVNVNSDLFFLSSDGQVRSASMSREEQKKWARVPMSREVKNWMKYWDKDLIPFGVLGYFQNKIFITCNPFRTKAYSAYRIPCTDVAHGGFVVLELDNISNLGQDARPTWAGLWTGIRPMDIVVNADRCFVMSKDQSFVNNIYEVLPDTTIDSADGMTRPVRSVVYTREYDFETPFQNKSVHSVDLSLNKIQGDFSLNLSYKPSQSSSFVEWREFKHDAPWRSCEVPPDALVMGYLGHSFRDVTLGSPEDEEGCDPVSSINFRVFRKMQLRFVIEGKNWELEEFKLKANVMSQLENQMTCDETPVVSLALPCNNDWAVGPFKICQETKT